MCHQNYGMPMPGPATGLVWAYQFVLASWQMRRPYCCAAECAIPKIGLCVLPTNKETALRTITRTDVSGARKLRDSL